MDIQPRVQGERGMEAMAGRWPGKILIMHELCESCSVIRRSQNSINVFIQVAGYVTKYDANDFTFITVKGSGHMVRRWMLVSCMHTKFVYVLALCMTL